MEKLGYRDNLARSLKETRDRGAQEEAQEILAHERETSDYKKRHDELLDARKSVETAERKREAERTQAPEFSAQAEQSARTFGEHVRGAVVSGRIWGGEYVGPDGAIAAHRKIFDDAVRRGDRTGAFSSRSSLLYSAAGNLVAQRRISQLPHAMLLFSRAYIDSNAALQHAGGVSGMSTGQLSVRASVTRRFRLKRASLECVQEALSRAELAPQARALFLLDRCRLSRDRVQAKHDVEEVVQTLLPQVLASGNERDATRIARGAAEVAQQLQMSYTNAAEFAVLRDMAVHLRAQAQELARTSSADQSAKAAAANRRWRW